MKKILFLILFFTTSVFAAPPITIVVPFPPGGFIDVFGRNIGRYLNSSLQQDVIIINRPGADGRLAMDYVAQQPANGSHLLIGSTGVTLFNRVLYTNLNTDYTAFENIVPMVRTPIVFVVSNKLGVSTFSEFIKLAQKNKLNCAGSSASSVFVGKYIFKHLTLSHIQFVPFKGSNDMIIQLMSGNIDCAFETNLVAAPLVRDKKIKMLAQGGQLYNSQTPNAILFSDIVPGLTFYNWAGVSILKATPAAEKNRIFFSLQHAASDLTYKNSISALNLEIIENPVINESWLNHEYRKFEKIRQQLDISKLD